MIIQGKQLLNCKTSPVEFKAILLYGISTYIHLSGNATLGMPLVKELEYFSNLQHSNCFVGHSFSKKAEGMVVANQGGSLYAEMAAQNFEKIFQSGSV